MTGLRWLSKLVPALMLASLITACGGGGDGDSVSKLSGTAATGAPIVGATVNVTCAGGSALTGTTGSDGSWEVTLSDQTLPCAVQISGGDLAEGETYHSIAFTVGTVNITPLTDLIVASLAGQDPATWFANLNASLLGAIDQTMLDNALNTVQTALGLGSALGDLNPLTSAFSAANGDTIDDILEALKAVVTDYNALLAATSNGDFSAFSDFGSAFAAAYASISNGGGGSTTCTSGTAMTYSGTAGVHTNGQQLCFTASTTSLAFSGKTLTTPVQNTAVSLPYSAYKFTDSATGYDYEVVFNDGNLYEINVLNSSGFLGQFALSGGSGGGSGGGTSSLTVTVNAGGVAAGSFTIDSIPAPANQTEFCSDVQSDSTFTQIGVTAGGTLTINSCSFSGNVGTISATLTITTPFSMTVPYTVTYTYN